VRGSVMLVAALVAASTVHGSPQQDTLTPELARAQRAVWEAWYAGDTAQVRALTPGLVAISSEGNRFDDQEATIRASAGFHARGGRLAGLSFTDLHVRNYGSVVMIYSRYHTVTVMGRDTSRGDGRATEVFVRQNGRWVNPGWHLDNAR
jgi:hypothetical protein